jgi:hypothetical protein
VVIAAVAAAIKEEVVIKGLEVEAVVAIMAVVEAAVAIPAAEAAAIILVEEEEAILVVAVVIPVVLVLLNRLQQSRRRQQRDLQHLHHHLQQQKIKRRHVQMVLCQMLMVTVHRLQQNKIQLLRQRHHRQTSKPVLMAQRKILPLVFVHQRLKVLLQPIHRKDSLLQTCSQVEYKLQLL